MLQGVRVHWHIPFSYEILNHANMVEVSMRQHNASRSAPLEPFLNDTVDQALRPEETSVDQNPTR
jgi:hypothetical protein